MVTDTAPISLSDELSDQSVDRLLEISGDFINKGTDEELLCYGYRRNTWKLILFYLLVILSCGVLYLVTYWKPAWRLLLTSSKCRLADASNVLLMDNNLHKFCEEIVNQDVTNISTEGATQYVSMGASNEKRNDADDRAVLSVPKRVILRYFNHRNVRYLWNFDQRRFTRVIGLELTLTCNDILTKYPGLSKDSQACRLLVYDQNVINVEVKSYARLFFEEILNPFYVFQIFSVLLWSLDQYYIYASCIVVISFISLTVELIETRKQRETLRDMVTSADEIVSVIRSDNTHCQVMASDLVPGDVLEIPPGGCVMPCDAVLVAGSAIVDESMLTGESVPVTKTQLAPSTSDELFSPDVHKRNTLFCGTQVIQTRYYGNTSVRAVVFRTGYCTAKGELVRTILFPKEMLFKFYQDSVKFIGFLACLASVGMIYSAVVLSQQGYDAWTITKRMLDIVTVAVPPALPAAMTVGTIYAQQRLKKAGIFCISPQRINLCGKLRCICFDKTGTLTVDGLEFSSVLPVSRCCFIEPVVDPRQLASNCPVVIAMATCHSLTSIGGELRGDPLDLSMFNAINWVMQEAGKDSTKFDSLVPTIVKPVTRDTYLASSSDSVNQIEIGILRQFTFSSTVQCMSVITRQLGSDHMDVFVKGAPEKLATLCLQNTLPSDFHEILQRYTTSGFRVIALASKALDSKLTWAHAQRISRDSVESELTFLGLMVFENKLKPETTPVIRQLRDASMRMVMITGDNIMTAVSVSRQCELVPAEDELVLVNAWLPDDGSPAKISWKSLDNSSSEPTNVTAVSNVDLSEFDASYLSSSNAVVNVERKCHLALTGRSFNVIRQHFPELLPKICILGSVFARMSPDSKSCLIEELQHLGLYVGMCGDGANDCGALRTAHAGISLSEAEASVASPFTSKVPNISCVPRVICEGRAALVTSFGVFKYMALYSIVQFISVTILYSSNAYLSDYMFLYIDLLIATFLVISMGHTGANYELVEKRPPSNLISAVNLVSLLLHVVIIIAFQAAVYVWLLGQPWYVDVKVDVKIDPADSVSVDSTTIFYISSFQYLMLAYALSKGPPFRKRIWTNIPFSVLLVLLTIISVVILLCPPEFASGVLILAVQPNNPSVPIQFRVLLMGISGINLFVVLIYEVVIADSATFKKWLQKLLCCTKHRLKPFKLIRQQLAVDVSWPPVGETMTALIGSHQTISVSSSEPSVSYSISSS